MTALREHVPGRVRGTRFVAEVFDPRIHVTYGVLWTAAYEAAAMIATGGVWRPSAGTLARAVTVIAVLLYLRLTDERMDEDYDRVHHPDRPLVTGLVTASELRVAGLVIVVLMTAGNALIDLWSAMVLAAVFTYAGLLGALVSRLRRLRDRPLIYLSAAIPVQALTGCYLYVSAVGTGTVPGGPGPALLVLVFLAAFLHFEFARKTTRAPAPGSRAYSGTALGVTGSGVLTLGWAVVACAILACVTAPWQLSGPALLPYTALVFPILAAAGYLRGRLREWPTVSAMLFLIVLDVMLLVSGGLEL